MSAAKEEDFPSEMKRPMTALHTSLTELKDSLSQFTADYSDLKNRTTSPLLKAKLELTKAYAINSLFWIYLTTKGVDPRDHPIKSEINRLKVYAERVKQIEDKQKAAKLDVNAAKRFVRSALWEPSEGSEDKNSKSNKRKLLDESVSDSKGSNGLLNKPKQNTHKKFKND